MFARVRSDVLVRRWVLWGALGVLYVLVNLNRLSTAVLSEDLMASFGTTATQLGTLHAVFFWVYAVMQIPTGVLADRFGPRRTATAGGLTMNVGAVLFAYSSSYAGALVGRGLVGLGASVIFVCILRFCASWFRADEFGFTSGLTFAVSGLGGVLATTPLAVAAEGLGWQRTIGALGAFGLVATVAVYAFVRDSPERAGFEPLEGVPEDSPVTVADLRGYLGTILRDRLTWVVGLMLFCTTGTNLTLFGLWGVPYVAQTYDVSVTHASTYTLLGSIGVMIGPPALGRLSDRLGQRTLPMVVGGVCYVLALGTVAVFGDPPLPVVGVVFFVAGVLIGAFVLSYAVVQERHPTDASGISTGTINGAAFFGAAFLPTLMGRAIDRYWTGEVVGGVRVYEPMGYRLAFAIATAAGAIALCCALWLYAHGEGGGDTEGEPESDVDAEPGRSPN
ncbi:MFS transporter [Natrialbaceae archaeon GCM10025810]|uniref:MFS transporter n=1 Tax=Halovalidus salilacus TaxID=3075124 RepID=UPI00361C7951